MARQERLRHEQFQDDMDSEILERAPATSRMLCQVFNGGSIPTGTNAVFLTNPVFVDGTEGEGTSASFHTDVTRSVPVLVIGSRVPVAGDMLIASYVGGKWVAESRVSPSSTRYLTLTFNGCVSSGLPNVSVTIADHGTGITLATGTTNSVGAITFPYDGHATIDVTAIEPSGRFETLNQSIPTIGNSVTLSLSPSSGYACYGACNWPISKTLHWTDSFYGSGTLTWSSASGWLGTLLWPCVNGSFNYEVNGTNCGCVDASQSIMLFGVGSYVGYLAYNANYTCYCCTTSMSAIPNAVGVNELSTGTTSCFVPGVSAFSEVMNYVKGGIPPYMGGPGPGMPDSNTPMQYVVTE